MDISYIERYPLSQRINLILAFVNNAKFCKGTTLEDGETTTLPHVTGQYVDFSEGTESVGDDDDDDDDDTLLMCELRI